MGLFGGSSTAVITTDQIPQTINDPVAGLAGVGLPTTIPQHQVPVAGQSEQMAVEEGRAKAIQWHWANPGRPPSENPYYEYLPDHMKNAGEPTPEIELTPQQVPTYNPGSSALTTGQMSGGPNINTPTASFWGSPSDTLGRQLDELRRGLIRQYSMGNGRLGGF